MSWVVSCISITQNRSAPRMKRLAFAPFVGNGVVEVVPFYDVFNTIPLVPESFVTLQFEPCAVCFSSVLLERFGWASVIPCKEDLMIDPLSEESVVGSESSSSDE